MSAIDVLLEDSLSTRCPDRRLVTVAHQMHPGHALDTAQRANHIDAHLAPSAFRAAAT